MILDMKKMRIPEKKYGSHILFQQGLLRIQSCVYALKEITVSKYQAGYEELGEHLVLKITI